MANKYWVNGSGAWSQPVFVKDTFTDTAGTDIASHTPDVGGAWTYRSGSTGDLVIDNNNRLRTASAADCRIIDATVPSSPDYVVQADITQVTNSTSTEFNIMGRYDLATDNWYAIHFYNGNNNIFLYKFISGSFTLLGTYGYTPTVGVPFNVQLVMSGTTIQAVLNGTLVLSVTDSSVTGAGHGGVRSFNSADNDSIGTRVDNFQVINSNWATSSGGIGSPANIPTSSDNVIFDINSGNIFTATMDYTTTIASISVAGNSNFGYHEDTGKFVTLRWNSNNNVVTVAGNVTFNGDVQFAGNSGVGGFVISASSTLTSYSKSFIPYIGINGSGINVTVAAGVSGGAGVFYNTNLTANYIDLLHGTLTLPEFDFGGNPQQNPVIKVDTFSASNSTLTRVLDFGGVGSLAGAYILVSTSFDCSVSTGLTFANTIGSQIYFNTQYVYAADSFIDETSDNLLTHTTDTGQHWIQPYEPPSGYDGTFSISSQNRAYYSNAGTLNRALYLIDSLIPVDDYFVQADMYVESVQGEAGIVGRAWNFQDTFYLFGYVGISPNANWELILVNDGSYTTLATSNATLTPGSTYTMKMTMIGNAITCYVNGSPIMAVTDSAIGNGTLFGAGGRW